MQDLTESFLKRRQEKTPKDQVFDRPGGGGKVFTYVKPGPMYRWLDAHYPGLWSVEVADHHIELAGFVYIKVTLTVLEPSTRQTRIISGLGCDEAILKDGELTKIQYLKAAETDGLKRCVAKLGGFNDIYQYADEDGGSALTEADMEWFYEKIVPLVKPKQLFKQIELLTSGALTIKELKERFK